jgi:hypothetical protein
VNVCALIRSRRHQPCLLPVAAALVGASVLAGLASCASGVAPANQPPPSSVSPGPLSPPSAVDAAYKNAVETRVAGSLHLTAGQVRAKLRANPGSDLEGLAKPYGLAEDQLARIILSGLDSAGSAASRSGTWTARQAHAEKMYWASQSYADVVTGVSSWFVNG